MLKISIITLQIQISLHGVKNLPLGWKERALYYSQRFLYVHRWVNSSQEKTRPELHDQFFSSVRFSELRHIVTDMPEFILIKLRKDSKKNVFPPKTVDIINTISSRFFFFFLSCKNLTRLLNNSWALSVSPTQYLASGHRRLRGILLFLFGLLHVNAVLAHLKFTFS